MNAICHFYSIDQIQFQRRYATNALHRYCVQWRPSVVNIAGGGDEGAVGDENETPQASSGSGDDHGIWGSVVSSPSGFLASQNTNNGVAIIQARKFLAFLPTS